VVSLSDQKVIELAKSLFGEYYRRCGSIAPPAVEKREFGFGDFEKKIAFRHMAFKNEEFLKRYLVENSPPFISYSTAEYERPDARPMEAKGWLGCELVFDLDASDLQLPCQEQHGRSWTCENCLVAVKDETIRLIEDFLMPDFGFSEKEISINFSGNRGYHVHVANDDVFRLSSRARREITEYIAGIGIDPVAFFPALEQRGKMLRGPTPTEPGWGGKFAREMISALNLGVDAVSALGVEKQTARMLVRNKAEVILGISVGNWDKVRIPKKTEFWKSVIANMSIKQSDSIDKNVTNDTHHLIRLPNTIHGDTGLLGIKIKSLNALADFKPMKDSIVLKDKTLRIKVIKSPQLLIGDEQFGPYENQEVELPIYAAMYLLLKRVATLK
jgi:DNA primase small subunit